MERFVITASTQNVMIDNIPRRRRRGGVYIHVPIFVFDVTYHYDFIDVQRSLVAVMSTSVPTTRKERHFNVINSNEGSGCTPSSIRYHFNFQPISEPWARPLRPSSRMVTVKMSTGPANKFSTSARFTQERYGGNNWVGRQLPRLITERKPCARTVSNAYVIPTAYTLVPMSMTGGSQVILLTLRRRRVIRNTICRIDRGGPVIKIVGFGEGYMSCVSTGIQSI
jgi:hypothetical protein